MAKILLDYVFPISVIPSVPAASSAFLKQVCVVCKPSEGNEDEIGSIVECTSMTEVAEHTDNSTVEQLFNAGMDKVFILISDDLDISDALAANAGEFWTLLISDDFADEDLITVPVAAVAATKKIQDILYTAIAAGTGGNSITVSYVDTNTGGAASASASGNAITVSIEAGVTTAATIATAIAADSGAGGSATLVTTAVDVGDETDPQVVTGSPINLENGVAATTQAGDVDVGDFDGVVGYSTTDAEVAHNFATADNHCAFFTSDTNKAGNMMYAFGKLLSNLLNWTNQQYITMPLNDDVDTLGAANSLFDDKVSFVIHDTDYGNRLALFSVGGKAVVAPYIEKNLRVDLQGRTIQWIGDNQPSYTLTNAALLEARLNDDVIKTLYIATGWIEAGVIEVKLLEDNFTASGFINVAEPKALWRMFGEMQSTL